MGRFPQPAGERGSLKWIQLLVNDFPESINKPLREACGLSSGTKLEWLSPLRRDQFAEYRDKAFLTQLSIRLEKRDLRAFWPRFGPQWDALGRSDREDIFLVEAKAHIGELLSPGTSASARSKKLIDRSLDEVQSYLGARSLVDWSAVLYQYINRLAHLYLLRTLNDVPAHMVFVYFVGDRDMQGPQTAQEWKSALQLVRGLLGLRDKHKLSEFIHDVFISVSSVKASGGRGEGAF